MQRVAKLFFPFASIVFCASAGFSQVTDATAVPVDVENVILDKSSVRTVCPLGPRFTHPYCNKATAQVKVTTTIKDHPTRNDITYYYVPSGGRIVGQGANVDWDLSEAPPGKHSLTVGVGAGGVVSGKTITRSLEIKECEECHIPCSCPSFHISGPIQQVKAGQAFLVHAEVGGDVTYDWTTSGGTIVDGQKNAHVLIRTTGEDAGKVITVTVEIGGTDPSCNCERIKTHKVSVVK